MNEKRMGAVILILLLLMNLLLFGYDCYQWITANWIPVERVEQISSLYQENGIEIKADIERKNSRQPILKLEETNLDQLVESFLEEPFEKSYIYGSQVQYVADDIWIMTDRKTHSISYRDEAKLRPEKIEQGVTLEDWAVSQRISSEEAQTLMEIKARDFAKRWLGEEVYLSKMQSHGTGYDYVFYQMREDRVLYFNVLHIFMLSGEVASADLTYWSVQEESEKNYEIMPIDEILYAQLGMIKEDMEENQKDEVVQIREGYQLKESEGQTQAVPAVMIVLKSGREYVMNRAEI